MAGTSEGGRKAAETRGHESLSAAGEKGGHASHSSGSHNQNRQHDIHASDDNRGNQRSSGRRGQDDE